jgi:predicted Zn-dependent protease
MSEKISRKELLELLSASTEDQREKKEALDDLDKKALEGYQYLENPSAADAIEKLNRRFDQWLPNHQVSRSAFTIRMNRMKLLRAVAAVALLLTVSTFFLLRQSSTKRLALQYFEAPPSTYLNLSRGGEKNEKGDLTAAFMQYEKKKYAEAAEAISQLVVQYPDKRDLIYYQGISLFASGQVDQAIDILKVCASETYQDVDKKTPWFLALAYLKKGDLISAKSWLEKAEKFDEVHSKDAAKILKKIR